LLSHISPFLAVVGEEAGYDPNWPGQTFRKKLWDCNVSEVLDKKEIGKLTLPAHSVSHTISSQIQNHISWTPPTEAFLKIKAPRRIGMRIMRTNGVMYVKYRTKKLELWTFLTNLERLVEGCSGGL
jgi:hypothetical protein